MHDLDIIKINKCLVAKILLTNVTKTNEHSNVATFVHALIKSDVTNNTKYHRRPSSITEKL